MNRITCMCLGILFVSGTALGQFTKGTVETSFTGSAGSMTDTYVLKSGTSTYETSRSYKWAMASCLAGYYILDGVSIEPEITLLGNSNQKPSWHLIANLSYTYALPGNRTGLFARAGYGITNSIKFPQSNDALGRLSDHMDIGIINLGAGVKHFIAGNVALRGELNWRRQHRKLESGSGNSLSSHELAYTSFAAMAGIMLSI